MDISVGRRAFRITAVEDQDLLLENSDRVAQFPFGFLLWESAVELARRILVSPILVSGRRVLEIGAGVGVAGIAAAVAGAHCCQTDHQEGALALARRNATQNGVSGIRQFTADWNAWAHDDRYDVLIAADITYDRAAHAPLKHIFETNLEPGGRVILSDPCRPQTLDFVARLEKLGWAVDVEVCPVERLGVARHAERVEIAIFSLTRQP